MRSGKGIPTAFIGSSTEGKQIADSLQAALEPFCESVVWDQLEPNAGVSTTLDNLIRAAHQFDFGIFVLTADDHILKRGSKVEAARDNVLFELGLFIGIMGKDRVFIVCPKDDILTLPTDLDGATKFPFRPRLDGRIKPAINPVAINIKDVLMSHSRRGTAPPSHRTGRPLPVTNNLELNRYVFDLIEALPNDRMGIDAFIRDEAAFEIWTSNLLGMLQDVFSARQPDAYSSWLRPTIDSPRQLSIFQSHNMPENYKPYKFKLNEGMAGKVWNTGTAASVSQFREHPWWVWREGCLSESYICVPVGEPRKNGGVLAVGSFEGFEATDEDIGILKIFAALLSYVSLPKKPK